MQPGDEDLEPGDESAPPYWFPGQHLPADAQRMGLTQHVPEGALLDFAGRLDGTNARHRAAAWVMLMVFVFPVALYVLRLLRLAF